MPFDSSWKTIEGQQIKEVLVRRAFFKKCQTCGVKVWIVHTFQKLFDKIVRLHGRFQISKNTVDYDHSYYCEVCERGWTETPSDW